MTKSEADNPRPPQRHLARSLVWVHIPAWTCIGTLIIVAFHFLGNTVSNLPSRSVFVWMSSRWRDQVSYGADYSIGWFIPIVSLAVLYARRHRILSEPRRVSYWGLPLVALALLLHWGAARAQQPRVSLTALVVLLWALPLTFADWRTARHFIFPCAYLLFCIPWNFLDALTFPMRLFSTALSAALLNGIGIGVVRSGTIIRSLSVDGMDFNVADPCSGLSSMLAMLALTALYANLTQRSLGRQAALFAVSGPLAMAGNIFRICTIAVVAQVFSRELALTLYHDYSAFLVFPVAILLMVGAGNLVTRFSIKGIKQWIAARLSPIQPSL